MHPVRHAHLLLCPPVRNAAGVLRGVGSGTAGAAGGASQKSLPGQAPLHASGAAGHSGAGGAWGGGLVLSDPKADVDAPVRCLRDRVPFVPCHAPENGRIKKKKSAAAKIFAAADFFFFILPFSGA